jgi:hypothetical protein
MPKDAEGRMRMQVTEVASASPGRMFSAGCTHLLIGLAWSLGPIVGFVADAGAATSEVRPEVVAIVVILWPLGLPIMLRGLALLQQSFGESGYFRATTDGLELRVGAPSLYARLLGIIPQFRVLPANPDTFAPRFPEDGGREHDGGGYVYGFRWNKIASFDVSMFALVIELRSGARLLLRRFYFVEDPVTIARRLNEITQRLRVTNPLANE